MKSGLLATAALALATLSAVPAGAQSAPAATPASGSGAVAWQIDPTHSELTFQIRHLVSRVRGTFGDWSGTIAVDPDDLKAGRVEVAIQTASIDTNNDRRDKHLRSGDFFDAEGHPAITFRSRRVENQGRAIRVHGDLTIRGVTKPVVLEGEYLGTTRGPEGKRRIGFQAETTINRHDYGVSWNRVVESGSMLGDEVTVELVVAATQG
jgi:polyisoprenoid-binding protein YceI